MSRVKSDTLGRLVTINAAAVSATGAGDARKVGAKEGFAYSQTHCRYLEYRAGEVVQDLRGGGRLSRRKLKDDPVNSGLRQLHDDLRLRRSEVDRDAEARRITPGCLESPS